MPRSLICLHYDYCPQETYDLPIWGNKPNLLETCKGEGILVVPGILVPNLNKPLLVEKSPKGEKGLPPMPI